MDSIVHIDKNYLIMLYDVLTLVKLDWVERSFVSLNYIELSLFSQIEFWLIFRLYSKWLFPKFCNREVRLVVKMLKWWEVSSGINHILHIHNNIQKRAKFHSLYWQNLFKYCKTLSVAYMLNKTSAGTDSFL